MLDVGMTVRDNVPAYTLKREAVSLDIPSGTTVPLASIPDYRQDETKLQALQNRAKVQSDSINYFPPSAHQACRIRIFFGPELRAMPVRQRRTQLSARLYWPSVLSKSPAGSPTVNIFSM